MENMFPWMLKFCFVLTSIAAHKLLVSASSCNTTFYSKDSSPVVVNWKEESCTSFSVEDLCFSQGEACIRFDINDPKIADVTLEQKGQIICANCNRKWKYYANISDIKMCFHGKYLGKTEVRVELKECTVELYLSSYINITESDNRSVLNYMKEIQVVNGESPLYKVFVIMIAILAVVMNFGFGCKIDLSSVAEALKQPASLCLGLCCQLLLMPLLSVALAKALHMSPLLGFGLLVTGCAPSGGGSNVWTLLMDGDLELSMTMTFISKTCALGTLTAWLFILGRIFTKEVALQIPYRNIVVGLLVIAIPCLLGVLLRRFKPRIGDIISKLLKPFSGLFLLWVIVVGSLTNLYIYQIMRTVWYVIPAGFLLPFMGMLMGFTVSKICRLPSSKVIAITVETGVQDTGISILLLLASFPKPEGSIASTIPVAAAIFTALPLTVALLVFVLKRKYCQETEQVIDDGRSLNHNMPILQSQNIT